MSEPTESSSTLLHRAGGASHRGRTAANGLVSRLAKLDILQDATGSKRNRVFRDQSYIAIFGENEPKTVGETKGITV